MLYVRIGDSMKLGVKILTLSLATAMIASIILYPFQAKAETLGDLKAKLAKAEEEYKNASAEAEKTQDQIDTNNQTVENLKKEVSQLQEDIKKLQNDIDELNKKAEKLDGEVKKVISFVQISSGDNAYLEYAFGAQDFTDFIYRMAVSEQVSGYNEDLIDEYDKTVADTKKKQTEMDTKKTNLKEKQATLEEETKKLGEHLTEVTDIKMSAKDEIEMQKEAIKVLENMGCSDNEDTKTCGRIPPVNGGSSSPGTGSSGIGTLPPGTSFLRPIIEGYVTSEYGYRLNPATGVYELHEALDVSRKGTVPIYPAADGVVIGTRYRSNCGGNMIFIIHTVNGKKYTTEYAHLRRIDVSVGQVVTQNTQIGIMGGDRNSEWWDSCSTAQHLHFGIAHGHYLKDYMSWNTFIANTYDPRQTVNFPWSGGATDYFKDRTTMY